MSRERVHVVGLEKLRANLHEAGTKAHDAASKAVRDELDAIRTDARRIAPHRTGDLERHIDVDHTGDLAGRVKSTSRHAGFVEHGTYKDKAQPYMRPAAELARLRLPKRAAAVIKAALESIR